MKITPYPEIRDSLKTMDVINCEHKSLIWRMIGHTAGVYREPHTGQLQVFESTTRNRINGVSGVQLTPMGLWLQKYPGKVYVRSMKTQLGVKKKSREFVHDYLGTSYPDLSGWSGRMKLIMASFDFEIRGHDYLRYKGADKGIFCTMLIAMWYQYCTLMNQQHSAMEYEPDDFRNGGKAEGDLMYCSLGEERRLK